jgi:hypothetical protein
MGAHLAFRADQHFPAVHVHDQLYHDHFLLLESVHAAFPAFIRETF